jgi:hypothetical protein
MALKFRRGTTAQQSGSLAFGEPYVNTTLGTLLIGGPDGDIILGSSGTGSTGNFGAISGSGLDITGNANIAGNLTLGGTITIGDANTDNLVVNADLSSSIIPDITNVFDLGSTTKVYRNVYATSISGAIAATNGVVSGSSQVILQSTTGFTAYNTALATITGSLISSASTDASKFTTLATYTGSVEGRFTTLATLTGSNSTRLTALEASASTALSTNNSQGVSVTNLNTFSGSTLTRLTALEVETANLESFTSSINTTIKTRLNTETVISGSSQVNADTITNFDANVKDKLNVDLVVSGSASDVKTFLSLQNVTNESKATMFTSPTFTGTPVAPTAPANTNSTQIATTAYVQQELTDLIGGANEAFDTLIEISASLASGDSTLNTLVDGKLAKASNLSDLTDTSAARTNLGVAIGTNVQAFNSTLASVAAGTYSGDDSITTIGTVTAGSVTAILPTGVVSGSSQIVGSSITTNTITIGSTSTTLGGTSTTLAGLTSVSSTGFTGALTGNASTATTLETARTINGTSFNGSANITIPNLVSGSSQITAGSTTNFATDVKTQLNSNTVVSGSGQINVASTTGDIALGTRTSGNYVASLVAGTNITLSNNTGEGATPTIGLTNNTISGIALGSNLETLTIGTGLSGTSYNGSTGVTIANTGVTSNVAGTGVTVSGATGAVTISIGQAVATSSNVQFNSLGVGMAASATAGRIDATNDIVAFSSSDIRFKENIKPIENALDKIRKISGNTYDWKAENKVEHGYEGNDVGVIAQEIEAVLPQLVQTRESGFKAVKYDKLVALLIEGIKEQQLQIEQLRIDLNNCKSNKGL